VDRLGCSQSGKECMQNPCADSGSKLMLASPAASQPGASQGFKTELCAAVNPPLIGTNSLSIRMARISGALTVLSIRQAVL